MKLKNPKLTNQLLWEIYDDFSAKSNQIYTGYVHQIQRDRIFINCENAELILPKNEQLPVDRYKRGESVRGIVKSVDYSSRGAEIILSRSDDKFLEQFTEATVKSWKGLKLKYLEDLVLVELGSNNPDTLLPYTEENAQQLVENSNEFDNWLNEVVFDLDHFRTGEQAKTKGQARAVSAT